MSLGRHVLSLSAARRLEVLIGLAAFGVAIAAYLTWVALDAEAEVECGPLGDCHTVQSSEYAEVAGIPVAVLGLAMYVGLLGLVLLRRLWREAPEALGPLTFALALSGTLYSAYLTSIELFVIDAICAWCVTSAVLVTIIWVLTWADLREARARRLAGLDV